jgi:biopolymer transport protein ExbB
VNTSNPIPENTEPSAESDTTENAVPSTEQVIEKAVVSEPASTQELTAGLPVPDASAMQAPLLNSSVNDSAPAMNSADLSATVEQLLELIEIGGPVVWILVALSIAALSIIILKLCQFAVLRPESLKDVNHSLTLWNQGKTQDAKDGLNSKKPVSRIVLMAMDGLTENKDTTTLQEELNRQANELMHQLRSLFRPLEVIASLSPLLGLMGTVLGMIVAFQQMEAAGNQVDPSVLSGGIWQALLTTAAGLAVAIPVAAVHSWLERKAERVAYALNDSVTQVFTRKYATKPSPALTGVSSCAA